MKPECPTHGYGEFISGKAFSAPNEWFCALCDDNFEVPPDAGTNALETNTNVITIRYRNYRGEDSLRRVLPLKIWFGTSEWHPKRQWLMDAYDYNRNAYRTFALQNVIQFDIPE
jgi:hypothetical protein